MRLASQFIPFGSGQIFVQGTLIVSIQKQVIDRLHCALVTGYQAGDIFAEMLALLQKVAIS